MLFSSRAACPNELNCAIRERLLSSTHEEVRPENNGGRAEIRFDVRPKAGGENVHMRFAPDFLPRLVSQHCFDGKEWQLL